MANTSCLDQNVDSLIGHSQTEHGSSTQKI